MAEPATKEDVERLAGLVKEDIERVINLMQGMFQDLSARMDERFEEVNARLDSQSLRLDRQGGTLQAGTRWISKMDGWAERVDAALEEKDRQIFNLSERVRKLEEGRK
ncbi:MAG TPA: hypothetical protein VGF59_32535 [Bryobacteraceae bacterium]|jgi:hypothetical protein